MKLVRANLDQMQIFVIIKPRRSEDKCRCEFKELIDKGISDKGLIRILAIANANVINHAMLENISIIITVSVEKGQLITQLKNVMKILMKKKLQKMIYNSTLND